LKMRSDTCMRQSRQIQSELPRIPLDRPRALL
jgi:hypothetical protein